MGLQKGVSKGLKGHLLQVNRACVSFEPYENSLQDSADKGISCL